jgi:hypothetical protein
VGIAGQAASGHGSVAATLVAVAGTLSVMYVLESTYSLAFDAGDRLDLNVTAVPGYAYLLVPKAIGFQRQSD